MGDVIAFPTATRHDAVERVARELYNRVNADLESLPEVILNRCYRTYVRATDAGVLEDVAEQQAEELRVALHKWCEAVHEVELWGEGVDREGVLGTIPIRPRRDATPGALMAVAPPDALSFAAYDGKRNSGAEPIPCSRVRDAVTSEKSSAGHLRGKIPARRIIARAVAPGRTYVPHTSSSQYNHCSSRADATLRTVPQTSSRAISFCASRHARRGKAVRARARGRNRPPAPLSRSVASRSMYSSSPAADKSKRRGIPNSVQKRYSAAGPAQISTEAVRAARQYPYLRTSRFVAVLARFEAKEQPPTATPGCPSSVSLLKIWTSTLARPRPSIYPTTAWPAS